MRITWQQELDFVADMKRGDELERAIEWIAGHIDPEQVFGEDTLRKWAKDNGFVEEQQ